MNRSTGITDLSQVKERRMPVRILGGTGAIQERVLAHYGLSHELINSWGGRIYRLPLRGLDEKLDQGEGVSLPQVYVWSGTP